MGKRILLGCYEVPCYGGANSASYTLFEALQNEGLDIHYLNIIDKRDQDYFRYIFGENYGNPKCLKNVYNCILKEHIFSPHPELTAFIRDLSPDILIGKGQIAALLMKKAAPKKDLIFMTSWCDQVKEYIAKGLAREAYSLIESIRISKGAPVVMSKKEEDVVENADLIITHSDMITYFYGYFYPSSVGKIHPEAIWSAEWVYKEALNYSGLKKPFSERDIDLLFISSIWSRPEKNYKMLQKIISKRRNLRMHIVGEAGRMHAGAEYHGLVTGREDIFSLLGRARTVVSPSLYDAAPGVLFEASAMGCNIIASRNCGNWKICNEKLLVDPFDLGKFLDRIDLSMNKKYEDNIDYFIQTHSYRNLLGILHAL